MPRAGALPLSEENRIHHGLAEGVNVGLGDCADDRLAGFAQNRLELVGREFLAVSHLRDMLFRDVDRADYAHEVRFHLRGDVLPLLHIRVRLHDGRDLAPDALVERLVLVVRGHRAGVVRRTGREAELGDAGGLALDAGPGAAKVGEVVLDLAASRKASSEVETNAWMVRVR